MPFAKPQVKRTYGCQNSKPRFAATESSSDYNRSESVIQVQDTVAPLKRKRPLGDLFPNNAPPAKKFIQTKSSTTRKTKKLKKPTELTQLHFCIDQPVVRTCPLCGLTYTRGASDDENLHKTHCSWVQRGLEWGREEEKEARKSEVVSVIEEDVILGTGERGRIVAIKPCTAGRLSSKVSGYLKTVNLALSAPDMPRAALECSKVYIFLLRTLGCTKEKIVGCAVAQRISSAMAIATKEEVSSLENSMNYLVHVEGNLYCRPENLPTTMGIPRLFVSSAHRRKRIARALLSAAAKTFIHGYELDPVKGEIAFSQPTSMGRTVMESWGGRAVRVYRE